MNDELAEGLAILQRRTMWARVFIIIVGVSSALAAVGVLLVLQSSLLNDAMFVGDMHVVDWLAVGHFIFLLISVFVVSFWLHRAHANLIAADLPALEYSPGWSIGWFFIPFANLFKPFQAMRELWHASHGAVGDYTHPAPAVMWVWWIGWLLGGLTSRGESFTILDVAGFVAIAISAGALLHIVNEIMRAQPSMSLASTFE